MRPPRIAILVFFILTSLLLVYRAVGSSQTSDASAATPAPPAKKSASSTFSWTAPFSILFPPNAAISLTDDNSTFFPARPAAFGPPLPSEGLSGQLWVGSTFSDDALQGHGDGELGCSDIPGWTDDRTGLAIKAAVHGMDSSRPSPLALSAKVPRSGPLAKDPALHPRSMTDNPSSSKAKAINDGTDDHLFIDRTASSEDTHADIQSMQETAEITGKIVLLSRGGCGFLDKVKWAQRRGAIALIVGDNQKGGPLIQMFAKGNAENVTIPSVFTTWTTAHLLSSLARPGSRIEGVSGATAEALRKIQRQQLEKSKGAKNTKKVIPSARRTFATPDVGHTDSQNKRSTLSKRSWAAWFFRWADTDTSSSDQSPSRNGHLWTDEVVEFGRDGVVRTTKDSGKNLEASENGQVDGKAAGARIADDHASDSQSFVSDNDGTDKPMPSTLRSSPKDMYPEEDEEPVREGLWVTITPTGSASPFLDTLVILVISPLVTLSVVYALLILRVKLRMRRWRAPKSVIDRLPVRTYHTVPSSSPSSRTPSPRSSSPTTPLLQGSPRSPSQAQVDGGSDSRRGAEPGNRSGRRRSPEKKTSRGSQWKKYMGRQVECAVCLEEYVDGVSQVMSLPCGHEFHADCITPWLTTRRRTCPICKNDVVRSLARGGNPSEPTYEPFREDGDDSTNESSDSFDERGEYLSPNNVDDLERGPSYTRGAGQNWQSQASRSDIFFGPWTRLGLSRFGAGASSSRSRPQEDSGDGGR